MLDFTMPILVPILVSEVLLPFIYFLIAGLIGLLTKWLRDWLKVEIEARHRDAFQTSLENAARMLIMRHGPMPPGEFIPPAILQEGLAYVKTGAPDAVKAFKARDETILERLLPHFLSAGVALVTRD